MSIRFKTGEFQEFIATRTFQLSTTGVTLQKGDEILFDGLSLKYADNTYSLPQLKGTITNGWLVPSAEYDENDANYGRPVSANIKVRNSKGENSSQVLSGVADDDERIVMNYNERNTKQVGKIARSNSTEDASSEGTLVRTLGSPKQRTVITPQTAQSLIKAAEEQTSFVPMKTAAQSQFRETAEPIIREGVLISTTVGSGYHAGAHTEEGVTFAPQKTRKRAKAVSVETPEPNAPVTVNTNVSRLVAKSICPDFPDNYDFAATERKKIARLQADFEDRPDVIRAVFAAETDAMKARLIAEFPEVFAA